MFPKVSSRVFLAPMAGYTDVAFRVLARRFGAGLAVVPFVSASGLVRGSSFLFSSEEVPLWVQLFGGSVDEVVRAVKVVKADLVDLNLGCPVHKALRQNAGAALLRDVDFLFRFVKRVVSDSPVPVTVKIRSGFRSVNAVEVARACEAAGVAAITVHPRLQSQFYSGVADWSVIERVKSVVKVPVIGNGDVSSGEDVLRMLRFADYVMIGRAALGNPLIFREVLSFLDGSPLVFSWRERLRVFFDYVALAESFGLSFRSVKVHALAFARGFPGAASFRSRLASASSVSEIVGLFRELLS